MSLPHLLFTRKTMENDGTEYGKRRWQLSCSRYGD